MLKLKIYYDANHEWLEARRDLVNALGIAHKISHYSYQNGYNVYLEGDCDASVLLRALDRAKFEYEVELISQKITPIRTYDRYRAKQ